MRFWLFSIRDDSTIGVSCWQVLPPELEREFVVLDFALSGKAELEQVVAGICESAKVPEPEGEALDAVLEAATGCGSRRPSAIASIRSFMPCSFACRPA